MLRRLDGTWWEGLKNLHPTRYFCMVMPTAFFLSRGRRSARCLGIIIAFRSLFSGPAQQLEKIREIAVVLEDWMSEDENRANVLDDSDSIDEVFAAVDNATDMAAQEEQNEQDEEGAVVSRQPDYELWEEETEQEEVLSNAVGNDGKNVNGVKTAAAITMAPLEGGNGFVERKMAQPLPG